MRVALVHDWLTGMRGGEYVLEGLIELFPQAELFTLIHVPGSVSPLIESLKIHTSPLQKVPFAMEKYRHFLPLMPWAIEQFDLRGFDLIFSSSHCVAKGVRRPAGVPHVSYIHAPMRYMWHRFQEYFGPGQASFPVRTAARALRGSLQAWDRRASQIENVDLLIANSKYIAQCIQECYGREAQVVHPFVDFERFSKNPRNPESFYLIVSAFAPYKRIDLAIDAFNRLKLPLQIVGSGQDDAKLRARAGPTVKFLGSQSNEQIEKLYSQCRAFVFPGMEDFGITPLEAMASGAPVIAYRAGGAAETVTSECGVFFERQTVDDLVRAIEKFEGNPGGFPESECRRRAGEFSKNRFQKELIEVLKQMNLNF